MPLTGLTGDHTAQGITLAANALTVARPGLYWVSYDLDVSIPSPVRTFLNIGNTNQRGSVTEFWPAPGQTSGWLDKEAVLEITAANQTITLWWIALSIPSLTGQVPQAPTAVSLAADSGVRAGYYTVGWTYSGRRVNTWNVQWRFKGETRWHADVIQVNNQASRSVTFTTHTTNTGGIDARVYGSNASGDGLYGQRTWGTDGTDGVFTAETVSSQTFAGNGDLIIASEDWTL